jgi:PAS domain S-box-containing protein
VDVKTREVVEINHRFSEMLGYSLPEDSPLYNYQCVVDSQQNFDRYYNETLRQQRVLPTELRIYRHKNGLEIPVERAGTVVSIKDREYLLVSLRDMTAERRRQADMVRDAQMAARVQNSLLSAPESSDYVDVTTIYKPFGYVGGDLYFLDWRYGGNLLRGFLVDATGHGLATALHTASLHVLLREVNERDLPLSDAIRWLNLRAGKVFDDQTFAAAMGFELDLQTRQLRWTCAGIPQIWVATQAKQGFVECPGMFLGIQEEETFDTHSLPIAVGDSFYFMTDGFADRLGRRTDLPLDQYPMMVRWIKALSVSEEIRDDATAVCICVRSLPQPLVRQDGWPRILHINGYGDYQRLKGEVAKVLTEVTGLPHSLLEVAVHEALANAMECRDGVPRQHRARVRFNRVGDRFIARVKTSRIGFAGNAILRRLRTHPDEMFSFVEDASMGRGIPMMLSMSHRMMYNSEGTEVLLAWKL